MLILSRRIAELHLFTSSLELVLYLRVVIENRTTVFNDFKDIEKPSEIFE